ncbi:MAG TPA: hypothetical protein VF101_19970 [Gaiellaceae bacterium]
MKVEERPNDVTIMLRSERDEHLSLHGTEDGILVTHYSPDVASSVHDEARVAAARARGWRDPQRHADYIAHWWLQPRVSGMDGHILCGRRIYLERAKAKRKYEAKPRITIDAPAAEFMVEVVLSTPEQPYSGTARAARRDELRRALLSARAALASALGRLSACGDFAPVRELPLVPLLVPTSANLK